MINQNVLFASEGFNRTYIFLLVMGKDERLLHKSSNDYDSSKPIHACGEPIPDNQTMITDAQAMALRKCPKCFPYGFKSAVAQIKEVIETDTHTERRVAALRAKGIGGGWL